MKTTRELYCQYLLWSQVNYTCTNLAGHFTDLTHDDVSRFLREGCLMPKLLWDKVKNLITSRLEGYMISNDVVIEKKYSNKYQGVRRQYSGNQHGVVKGIGKGLPCGGQLRLTRSTISSGSSTTASMTQIEMVSPSSTMCVICC